MRCTSSIEDSSRFTAAHICVSARVCLLVDAVTDAATALGADPLGRADCDSPSALIEERWASEGESSRRRISPMRERLPPAPTVAVKGSPLPVHEAASHRAMRSRAGGPASDTERSTGGGVAGNDARRELDPSKDFPVLGLPSFTATSNAVCCGDNDGEPPEVLVAGDVLPCEPPCEPPLEDPPVDTSFEWFVPMLVDATL